MIIDDDDEQAPHAPAPTSHRVLAFNGGGRAPASIASEFADLAEQPGLHDYDAHLYYLKGPPLDAVHMLVRSQIPDGDRAAQPRCAAAVIKAHHDLRCWEPLLSNRRFTEHVADFIADLTRLREHRPEPSRTALWQLWKQSHDGLLALLPEEERLAI